MRRIKQWSRSAAAGPALALGRMGFTPNALTVVGSFLTGCVGIIAAQGWFLLAGALLCIFAATDTLDGALARATNRVSLFGAFLDSVCDRYAEAGVFLGLLWWYQSNGDTLGVVLAYLAIIGSLMVSYARARAEGIGLDAMDVGFFQRPERIVTLGVGFAVGQFVPQVLLIVLALLAVLTTVTVMQRAARVASALSIPSP